MTSMSRIFVAGLLVAVNACAGSTAAPRTVVEAPTDPSRWEGDARLYRMLSGYPITAEQRDSLTAYAGYAGSLMDELLAQAAEDAAAPSAVRANALFMLAERVAGLHLGVFRSALDDDDARVRATAAASMRQFSDRYPAEALQIARMALLDPAPEVQAQALPIIGSSDVPLLRRYIEETEHAELRRVAQELVAVAEQRGAPLLGDTATGVLRRTTPHGFTVTFTPGTYWPQWDAAVGRVQVQGPGGVSFSVDSIEAVRGVVPLFFSPEGTHAIYERARTIVVRDLSTGTERIVGPGVAPRIRPFAGDFVYLQEAAEGRTDLRDRTHIRYRVMRGSFTDPTVAEDLGALGAFSSYAAAGNYSPVRWMRVEDRGGYYYLAGDEIEQFALPDPFATAGADR